MKTIDIHQVDAFTNQIFGGNPAGVVTNASEITVEEMSKIAREMNLSETAFVLPPTSDTADIRLRYFTPTSEVNFCGHATIATLYELSRLHMYGLGKIGQNTIRVETAVGILEMSVLCSEETAPRITFAAPSVEMEDYRLQGQAFASEFSIPQDALLPTGKILIDRTLNYIYIPIVSLEQLGTLVFDYTAIRTRFAAENIIVFCLFTNETFSQDSHIHTRGLAPLVGIDEDPFTGSMQSGLAHAAKQVGFIDNKQSKIIVEQGNFMGRPGFAEINHNNVTDEIQVTASAAQVFSTTMELQS